MPRPKHEGIATTIAVVALAGILVFIGILQYRWSFAVSEAENARMKADLQASMEEFRHSLTRELGNLCLTLNPKTDARPEMSGPLFSRRLAQWKEATSHDDLVKGIYLAKEIGDDPSYTLFHLDIAAQKFVTVQWPRKFSVLPSTFTLMSAVAASHQAGSTNQPGVITNQISPSKYKMLWSIHQTIPALVYPIVDVPIGSGKAAKIWWLIVELDPVELRDRLIPQLVRSQFSAYRAFNLGTTIVGGTKVHPEIIYASDQSGAAINPERVVGTLGLWTASNPPGVPDLEMGSYHPKGVPESSDEKWPDPVAIFAFHDTPNDTDWSLVVESRDGSFDALVSGLRRRNLELSFGILLVLAAAAGVLIITTHRARRLAQSQMDFVTGVTHELRTPLAVIQSAAENIKDGVISNPAHLARYGGMIHRQTSQLMQLVEQVLQFASSRQSRPHYVLAPVEVNAVIDAALENSGADSVIVERVIEPRLPAAMADFVALTRCVQNLVTNAIKYGGPEPWLRIKAWSSERADRPEVNIEVEDHGAGISAAEMNQIFEPFYRSPSVSASNIHGTGLGLPLTKSLIEAMSGRITATSVIGKGSSFVLHLSAAVETQTAASREADTELLNTKSL